MPLYAMYVCIIHITHVLLVSAFSMYFTWNSQDNIIYPIETLLLYEIIYLIVMYYYYFKCEEISLGIIRKICIIVVGRCCIVICIVKVCT